MRIWLITAVLALSSIAPRLSWACGTLSLSSNSISLTWSESYTSQAETVTISRSTVGSCNFLITFTQGGGGGYTSRRVAFLSNTLGYQIYSASSLSASAILKDFPAATNNSNVVRGNFSGGAGGGTSKNANYWFEIPLAGATTPLIVKAGTYTDTYQAKLWKGTLVSHGTSPHDTDTISVTVVVPALLRISLVPTGAGFNSSDTTETLNFGTLTTGASQGFDVRTVTNAGYALSVSSGNNGVLKHANPSVTTTVPYNFKVGGVAFNLTTSASSPVAVANVPGQTGLNGDAKAFAVEIGNVDDKVAGAYSDTILVTATTTE